MIRHIRKLVFNLTKPNDLYFYDNSYWVDVSWDIPHLEYVFETKYNHPNLYRKIEVSLWGNCTFGDTWINLKEPMELLKDENQSILS